MTSRHHPASAAKTVLIVANPSAGSRRREDAIAELERCLRQVGLDPQMVAERDGFPAVAASCLAAGQLRAIVAAGGDGTVAEVVNRTSPQTPITVFPLGTANLLAGYCGIRRDPQAMAQMLCDGQLVRIDAGARQRADLSADGRRRF